MPTLAQHRNNVLTEVRNLAKSVEDQGRDFTKEERDQVNDLMAKANDYGEQAKAQSATRGLVEQAEQFLSEGDAGDLNEHALKGAQVGAPGRAVSFGEAFVKSKEYAAFRKANPNGLGDRAPEMEPFHLNRGYKSLLTSGGIAEQAGDASGLVIPPQRLGLQPYVMPEPVLRNFVTVGQTASDKIEYAQILPYGVPGGSVNRAAGVKEATGTDDGSGVKPESELRFRKKSADVITVAHYFPATRRALSDASQLRSIIDEFLRKGLAQKVDAMMLKGDKAAAEAADGDHEEWDGILKTDGVLNQDFTGNEFVTIRKAISKVVNQGAQVTGVLVSPELDEALDLAVDGNNRFQGGGPWGTGPSTIWGRPRIVAPELSGTGKFILGDLSTCVLWDREQTAIYATDAHKDWFTRNMIAILAELRAGFGIMNPSHLVVGAEAGSQA